MAIIAVAATIAVTATERRRARHQRQIVEQKLSGMSFGEFVTVHFVKVQLRP